MAITLNKKDIDQEIDILEENIDDDLLKTLSSAKTDSITPLKTKQRKVIQFKSRVLELVEIFIKNSKNPTFFIEKMHPFIKLIADFKNPDKTQFINRVCAVINNILSKGDISEHLDNIQLCGDTLITYVHKCQEKSLNNKFIELLDLIFKALQKHNKKAIADILVKGLNLLKKNSNIKTQDIRKFIFSYSFTIVPVLSKIIQMCEINEVYDRSKCEYSSLLFILMQNEKMRQKICSKEKLCEKIVSLAENTLQNYEKQKYKKVAVFRQIMHSYKLLGVDTLKDQIQQFQSNDSNIQSIIDKLK